MIASSTIFWVFGMTRPGIEPSSLGPLANTITIMPKWVYLLFSSKECPRGVLVKAMDYGIVVSEFELQSRYYIHFRANTLGKGMNPLILPAMG